MKFRWNWAWIGIKPALRPKRRFRNERLPAQHNARSAFKPKRIESANAQIDEFHFSFRWIGTSWSEKHKVDKNIWWWCWRFEKRPEKDSIKNKVNGKWNQKVWSCKYSSRLRIDKDYSLYRLVYRLYTICRNVEFWWSFFQEQELEELIEASKKDIYFPVSCQEYADNGATQNGSYRVQPNANISRKYISLIL